MAALVKFAPQTCSTAVSKDPELQRMGGVDYSATIVLFFPAWWWCSLPFRFSKIMTVDQSCCAQCYMDQVGLRVAIGKPSASFIVNINLYGTNNNTISPGTTSRGCSLANCATRKHTRYCMLGGG